VPLPPERPEFEQLRRWYEERGGRLGALFEGDAAASDGRRGEAAPSGEDASGGREPGRWLKVGFVLSLATVLLTSGLLLGHVWSGQQAMDVPATAPAPPPATRVVTRTVVPPACLSALNQSDAAIHLLRGNVRDPKLVAAVRAYQKARDDCRRRTAGH
jgi:hypothetical protein